MSSRGGSSSHQRPSWRLILILLLQQFNVNSLRYHRYTGKRTILPSPIVRYPGVPQVEHGYLRPIRKMMTV